jgi:hypothetical protein
MHLFSKSILSNIHPIRCNSAPFLCKLPSILFVHPQIRAQKKYYPLGLRLTDGRIKYCKPNKKEFIPLFNRKLLTEKVKAALALSAYSQLQSQTSIALKFDAQRQFLPQKTKSETFPFGFYRIT